MTKKKTKKKLAPAPSRNASDRRVAEFWEAHSVADYWDDLLPSEIEVSRGPRRVVTLRLDSGAVDALRAIAKQRGMDYSALARSWISERLRTELEGRKRRRKAG
jgi:hypothetical protein